MTLRTSSKYSICIADCHNIWNNEVLVLVIFVLERLALAAFEIVSGMRAEFEQVHIIEDPCASWHILMDPDMSLPSLVISFRIFEDIGASLRILCGTTKSLLQS